MRRVGQAVDWSVTAKQGDENMPASTRFIEVKVKPRTGASTLRRDEAGVWCAQLRSPPVDGKANAELIQLIARHFGCPKAAVSIKSGSSGRTKLLKIEAL